MSIKISAVIPSYNSYQHISSTLQALALQETEIDHEIILVDCSDDSRVKDIAELFSNVTYVHREERFNPGEGRNIGAHLAHGELLIFVDSDLTLQKDAVQQAWKAYQQEYNVFGGAIELNEENHPTVASYLEHYYFNHESQKLRPRSFRNNLSSALMVICKELFLSEGGFKDIPRMQDTEFTERLIRKGIKLSFIPEVMGYQQQDSPIRKVLKKIYINGYNLYDIRYRQGISFFKKLLFITALPWMAILKVARIIYRHLKYQDFRGRLITLGLIPLLLLSGIYWMTGFYNSLIFEAGIMNDR